MLKKALQLKTITTVEPSGEISNSNNDKNDNSNNDNDNYKSEIEKKSDRDKETEKDLYEEKLKRVHRVTEMSEENLKKSLQWS